METYSLDVDAIMEAKLTELMRFGIVPFKGSRESNECWTLLIKFVIIGKTTTSNEKTVIGNILLFYVSMWKTTLFSANWLWVGKSFQQRKNTSRS